MKAWGEATSISINISRGVNTARATSISSNMSRGVSTARSSSENLCYSMTSIASSTREAESDSYSVSSARATPTLSAAPGTAESVSYSVSSAVES